MKKAFTLFVIATVFIISYTALASAYIYVEEEDRDPDSGYKSPGSCMAWARCAAHYDPQTEKYTDIEHNHDDYSILQHYFQKFDSDWEYAPQTGTKLWIYLDGYWQFSGCFAVAILD